MCAEYHIKDIHLSGDKRCVLKSTLKILHLSSDRCCVHHMCHHTMSPVTGLTCGGKRSALHGTMTAFGGTLMFTYEVSCEVCLDRELLSDA